MTTSTAVHLSSHDRPTKPPRAVQRILFGALAPLTRLRGLLGDSQV